MTDAPDDCYVIEPLDPERHDRTAFSCGVESIDNFFRKTTGKLARADNARVHVMTAPDGTVIGFHAMNAHAVDYRDLPPRFARTRPAHGSIPAAFLSMLAVDRRHAGKGHGGELLADALLRIAQASDRIGISVVILDVLDDGDGDAMERRRTFYSDHGFQPLASNPLRLFLPVATIRALLAEAGDRPGED